jgi:pSer/pThr/pTyr-binding forkhead associated (FHA) protein
MLCKKCGAKLDMTMASCAACGAEVELGRLTGILGVVCRSCDSYNEPGARTCAACGKPLRTAAVPEPTPPAVPAAAPPSTPPAGAPDPFDFAAVARAVSRAAADPAPSRPPPAPGSPVIRSFARPTAGTATRFVPSVRAPAATGAAPPASPAAGAPVALVSRCPRCAAEITGTGKFCANCGQALGARGTAVMMKPPAGPAAPQALGPLAPGGAKLVLDAGGGAHGETFRLDMESAAAGRTEGAITFPGDPCLAPHHATFFFRDGALHVRDAGAPGGLYLRLRGLSVPIRPGDHFAVGERLLRYAGPLPAAPPPPTDGTRRLGSPRPPAPALVVEEWLEGGAAGRVFVRGGPTVAIGRAGCAVSLGDDPTVSQAHAELLVDAAGNVRLKDLGSSNGTYLKVPPRAERELRDGDRVRIGREVLRVAMV